MATRQADDPLEAWVDEATRRCIAADCHGLVFEQMRERHGTVSAMERLMRSGEIQSGLLRLWRMGMKNWSIEAGLLKFPERFKADAVAAAQFRLDHIGDERLR